MNKTGKKLLERAMAILMSITLLICSMPTTLGVSAASNDTPTYSIKIVDNENRPLSGALISLAFYDGEEAKEQIHTIKEGKTGEDGIYTVDYIGENVSEGTNVYYMITAVESPDFYSYSDNSIITVGNMEEDIEKVVALERKKEDTTFAWTHDTLRTISHAGGDTEFLVEATSQTFKGEEITYSVVDVFTLDNVNVTEKKNDYVYKRNGKYYAKSECRIVIAASIPGNDEYASKIIQCEVTVVDNTLSIDFGENTPKKFVYGTNGNKFTISATVKNAKGESIDAELSYEVTSGSNIVSVGNKTGLVTVNNTGSATIKVTAKKEGYLDGMTAYTFEVADGAMAFEFEKKQGNEVTYGDNGNIYNNAAVAKDGQGKILDAEISYRIKSGAEYAEIEDSKSSKVTIVKPTPEGTRVEIEAVAEYANYASATISYFLEINKADQSIEFAQGKEDTITYGTNVDSYSLVARVVNVKDFIDGKGYGAGPITYSIEKDENNLASINASGLVEFNFETYQKGTVVIRATKAACEYYNECYADFTLNVVALEAPEVTHSLEGKKGENGWYIGDVTVLAPEGYEIGLSSGSEDDNWKKELVLDDDFRDYPLEFYLKNEEGSITEAIRTENIYIDKVAPEALGFVFEPAIDKEGIVFAPIYFGTNVRVKMVANDSGSGVLNYVYYVNNIPYTITEDNFVIPSQFRGNIEFLVIDKAGWRSDKYSYEHEIVVDADKAEKSAILQKPSRLIGENAYLNTDEYKNYYDKVGYKFLYNQDTIVALTIKEDNFDGWDNKTGENANVKVYINDQEYNKTLSWAKDADDETIYHADIELSEDGEYNIKVYYEDFSTIVPEKIEEQSPLVLPTIIVDKTAPARTVDIKKPITVVDEYNKIKTFDDEEAYKEYNENPNVTYYYNDSVQFEVAIEEKNFDSQLIVVKVNNEKREINPDSWRYSEEKGYYTSIDLVKPEQNGTVTYSVEISGEDQATNEMQLYTSPKIIIDTAPAEIEGKLSKPYKYNYYNKKNELVDVVPANGYDKYFEDTKATFYYGNAESENTVIYLQVKEANFFAEDVVIKISDINGNADPIEYSDLEWTSQGLYHTATIPILKEGIYTAEISYVDRSTVVMNEDIAKYESPTLVVDYQAPSNVKVNYPAAITEKDNVNYYGGKVELRFTADDNISGVDYYDWKFTNSGMSSDFAGDASGKIDVVNGEYKIDLPIKEGQQINGIITITAHDNSGNTSIVEGENKVVVDTVAPTRKVFMPTAKQVIDASTLITKENYDYNAEKTNSILYYDGNAKISFEVDEANFFAEDVIVKINGTKTAVSDWTETKEDVYRGSVMLTNDGEYVVEIVYTDRSGNIMTSYKSEKIVVDKTAPVIKVVYSNLDSMVAQYSGVEYYNTNRTATITITDSNFRADNVKVTVTAKDATGKDIQIPDYAKYLATRSNWTTNGNIHTAEITYSTDANYTFDIEYTDLALRKSANYAKDKFTVDKKKPSGLSVSYSESVLESLLKNVTFGFYNQKVTVTIKAKDETSGIYEFVYDCINSEGVSKVNAEIIDKAIQEAKIKQDGYNFTASFTIPKDKLTKNDQFNGNIEFTAYDRAENSKTKTEEKRIVVDNIAPEVSIKYNEPTSKNNGVSYYAGKIDATISINEANFYEEDVEVSVTKDGKSLGKVNTKWTSEDTDHHTGTFTLSDDGDYVVSVKYSDRSGNDMKTYESEKLVIDKVKPTIKVSDIVPNTANKADKYGFTITVDDKDMNISSLNATLKQVTQNEKGEFVTKDIKLDNIATVKGNKTYKVALDNVEEDGIYTLTCSVSDYAKNNYSKMVLDDGKEYESVTFSINRDGSVFTVDEETQKMLDAYYAYELTNDITISEINVDPIETYELKLNGKTLVEGTDYTTTQTNEDGQWSVRKYVLKKSLFEMEGQYNIVVESVDKTGTVAYSDVKNLNIAFVVDKTAPVLTITGLSSDGRYQTEEQTVIVAVSDDGGKPYSFKAVVYDSDGNPIKDSKGNDISVRVDMTGQELEDYLLANGNKVTFTIPEGIGYEVRVLCNDYVQNGVANEYSQTFSNVTVSSSQVVMFYANRPLFYGSIITIVVLLFGIIFLIIWRRKKKEDNA